jgi:RNAse (barnase) inhibitor barstar
VHSEVRCWTFNSAGYDYGYLNARTIKVKEQYHVTVKNRFSVLENFGDNGDINRAWDAIRENIKISGKECIGHCEAKRHKPWFDEECLKLVD